MFWYTDGEYGKRLWKYLKIWKIGVVAKSQIAVSKCRTKYKERFV